MGKISSMQTASTLNTTDMIPVVQGSGNSFANKKTTIANLSNFIFNNEGINPEEMTGLADDVSDLKSALKVSTAWHAPTPAIMPMWEKVIFNTDIGYAPQGIAAKGDYIYVCNGATSPLNVITEINIKTGTYNTHSFAELSYGGNSLTIDPVNNVLYVAEHRNGRKIHSINLNNWTYIAEYTMTLPAGANDQAWNIVYDPIEDCFYTYAITDIYKLDKSFNVVSKIVLNLDQDKYPVAKPGITQGFGYDGTYLYIPRSDVYDVYGNSFTFVVDKSGEIIKYYRGKHHEIEEFTYDFVTGNCYCAYASGSSGYVTKFTTDSGWLSMEDYFSDNYQSKTIPTKIDISNTAAYFRVKNGVVYFKGSICAINNAGTLCYLDGEIAPSRNFTALIMVSDSASINTVDVIKVNFSNLTYWSPDFQYLFVPVTNAPNKNGYWHLDGISAPLYRD